MPEKLKRSFVLFLTDHNFKFSSHKWKWNAPQNLFTNSIRKLFSVGCFSSRDLAVIIVTEFIGTLLKIS